MYNSKRINSLENDVGKLKTFVDEMRKHFEFDLFDEIKEFESAVSIMHFRNKHKTRQINTN